MFRCNEIISDGMIVQRNKTIAIFGTGTDGTIITGSLNGHVVSTEVKDGKWLMWFAPLPAEKDCVYEISLTDGCEKKVIKGVRCGEVFLAGGQSNMEFKVREDFHAKEEIALADRENIYFFTVPSKAYEEEAVESACWKKASSATCGEFSAVAWYFAKKISRTVDCPVAIIDCTWGGTSASCWIEKEILQSTEEISFYWNEYTEKYAHIPDDVYFPQFYDWKEKTTKYVADQEHLTEENPSITAEEIRQVLGDYPRPPPIGPRSQMRPSGIYYTMLRPLSPYSLRGIIYYQGESDAEHATVYSTLLSSLIGCWRRDFMDPNLPFFFVQLPFYDDKSLPSTAWATIRQQQQKVADEVPNTACIVTLDCGEQDNIHPIRKQVVGERLAGLVARKVYGCMDATDYRSPRHIKIDVTDEGLDIIYDMVLKNDMVEGFEVCGADGEYVPVAAVAKGQNVSIKLFDLGKVHGVRYAYRNYMLATLYGENGVPAAPFQFSLGTIQSYANL